MLVILARLTCILKSSRFAEPVFCFVFFWLLNLHSFVCFVAQYDPSGRYIAVIGEGDFVIYTAIAWRSMSFGPAVEFVWGSDKMYAVRDSSNNIKIFHNFEEKASFKPGFQAEGMFGGPLLCVRGRDFSSFYDWQTCRLVTSILDLVPRSVRV